MRPKGGHGRKNETADRYDPVKIDPSFTSTAPNKHEQPTGKL